MERSEPEPEWYCVRTKSKSEHIAAAHLRQLRDVEVFCPRIRYVKSTRRGKVWFTEALFPGYLLVKFDLRDSLRAVSSAHDVTKVVRFGEDYPAIGGEMVEELKSEVDSEGLVTIADVLEPGVAVEVMEGPMMGMKAVVKRLLPAKARVQILLEILGRTSEVEVAQASLLSEKKPRDSLATK